MIGPNHFAQERERQALQREREEREQEERERLEKASRRLARFIFEEDPSASAQAEMMPETTPETTPSADAGAHGMEPQKRESPAEQLADILLYNQGVPTEPWR